MAKREQHRVNGGQDARSERPATGYGQPRAATMERHRLKTCATEGAPSHPFAVGGKSIRIGSVVSGIRLDASTSPAAQPAIIPTVSASDRTRE